MIGNLVLNGLGVFVVPIVSIVSIKYHSVFSVISHIVEKMGTSVRKRIFFFVLEIHQNNPILSSDSDLSTSVPSVPRYCKNMTSLVVAYNKHTRGSI